MSTKEVIFEDLNNLKVTIQAELMSDPVDDIAGTQVVMFDELKLTITAAMTDPTPEPDPPDIVVTAFEVVPESIAIGASWTAKATVKNNGGQGSGEVIIGFISNGTKIPLNSKDPGRIITLDEGATGIVTWSGKGTTKGAWTFYSGNLTDVLYVAIAPPLAKYDATVTVQDKTELKYLVGASVKVNTLTGVTGNDGKVTLGPVDEGDVSYSVTMNEYKPVTGTKNTGAV
jgi:hypothetical protein